MSNSKRIIGLCGRIASGKGVLANALKETYGSETVTVANALKQLICEMRPDLFPNIQELNRLKRAETPILALITEHDINFISTQTNVPIDVVKEKCEEKHHWENARDFMQFIGTEIIRKYNPNWHVQRLKENILSAKSDFVCVDDVRFPNERAAVEELGGVCYFIIRPQSESISNHESETSIRWQDFDPAHVILNESTENVLKNGFVELFDGEYHSTLESTILLSGNDYYTQQCVNFGYETIDKNESELLEKILQQNKDEVSFRKHGIISFYTDDFSERVKFAQNVLRTSRGIEFCRHRFVVYNPLIYENLKFYL